MSEIDTLEEIAKEYAGIFAKHVLEKQLKDLGLTRASVTKDAIGELAKRVVKNAIFDPRLQEEALKKLKKQLHLYEAA